MPSRERYLSRVNASIADNAVSFSMNTNWMEVPQVTQPDRKIVALVDGKVGEMFASDLLATMTVPSKLKKGKTVPVLQGTVMVDGVVHAQTPKGYELEAKEQLDELLGLQHLGLQEKLSEEQFQSAWKSIAKAFDAEYVQQAEGDELVLPTMKMDDDEMTWSAHDDSEILGMDASSK